jgi:hypothetical protein
MMGVGDADIARIGESIRARLDKATAHSEMHASRLDSQMDDALGTAELDMQLEERKRRLGLESAVPSYDLGEESDSDSAASEI